MASELLKQRFEEYQYHIKNPEIEEKVLQAMIQAERVALTEGDIEFGIKIKTATIENLNRIVERVTNGGNIAMLEDFAQKNKQEYPYINWYYDSLLVMARDDLDAFWLYLERDRKREERFYEPRRKTLLPITDAFMDAEYHRVNEIFLHQPPRTGKSQDTTGAVSWHCGRNTELSNLYVTHNNDLGGAFVDGVEEIMFDPTYRYHDIFPEIKIADKDAQAHEIDFGRKKKYKSLSGKGLEAGLNGKYDANGWLINDDLLIDLPADTYMHALNGELRLDKVKHLLITHSHVDHFYPLELTNKVVPYAHNQQSEKLKVYGGQGAKHPAKSLRDFTEPPSCLYI